MAFSFVVEDGSADSDATSYVTVEYADDYVEANIHASAEWLALEEETKQRLLVRSSKYLDRVIKWEGERVDGESGLRWPRSGVYDSDNFLIADDSIPAQLKDAVSEMAAYLMNDDWTDQDANRGLKEAKLDVLQVKFDTDKTERGSVPTYIVAMLDGLGLVSNGRRPAFKKIIRH